MRNSFDAYYSSDMKPTGSSEHREQGRHRWGSQLPVRLAGRFRELPSVALAMKLIFGGNGRHMLPVDLVYTGAAPSWILLSSCEHFAYEALLKVLTRDYCRLRSADASRQWDQGKGVTRASCDRQQGDSALGEQERR
jgi:hypothetical protein